MQKRRLSFDLLKLAATFAVVFIHLSTNVKTYADFVLLDTLSVRFQIYNTSVSLGCWCVGVFILLSGFSFLNPKKNVDFIYVSKKVRRLLLVLLFWNAFYQLISMLAIGKLNIFESARRFADMLKGESYYHLWFIYLVVILYLLTPLLRMYIFKLKKRQLEYLLLISFVFLNVIPFAFSGVLPFNNYLKFIYYLPIYVCGYYICAFPPQKKIRRIIYSLGVLCFALTPVLNTLFYQKIVSLPDLVFTYPNSPTNMVTAVALAIFFKEYFTEQRMSQRLKKAVSAMIGCSFGIYLCHVIFLEIAKILLLPLLYKYATLIEFPLAVIIFVLSYLLIFVLKKIPLINKLV